MKPFKFTANRVWRCYLGGKLIDRLRGDANGTDGLFPEDWIASTVEANNPQQDVPEEGISTAVVDGEEVSFASLTETHAEALFGAEHVARCGRTTGFLMKLLDAAIRLPLQAHPDREAARRLYNSEYGKTEVWIVLDTRPIGDETPYLLLGFNHDLDRGVFVEDCLRGEVTRPLGMVHRHPVKPGDVVLLTGGLIHAIGPGVFLVEIMEPTDLVTQPEPMCGSQPLTKRDQFGAIAPEKAMEVFDYTPASQEQAWAGAALAPRVRGVQGRSRCLTLVGPEDCRLFGGWRIEVEGAWRDDARESGFFAGVVTQGAVELESGGGRLGLRQGETFFVPFSAGRYEFRGQGVIICGSPPVG